MRDEVKFVANLKKEYLWGMSQTPQCPKCSSQNAYPESTLWVCPECFYEWDPTISTAHVETTASTQADNTVKDANGNILNDGDSVSVIKELKIKGATSVVKVGTKVKNIRLSDGGDGHNISCKIEGIGAINLKSEFVRKA